MDYLKKSIIIDSIMTDKSKVSFVLETQNTEDQYHNHQFSTSEFTSKVLLLLLKNKLKDDFELFSVKNRTWNSAALFVFANAPKLDIEIYDYFINSEDEVLVFSTLEETTAVTGYVETEFDIDESEFDEDYEDEEWEDSVYMDDEE